MNKLGKLKSQADMHRWEEEMQRCQVSMCRGEQHGMKCADCGIRRFGPYAEHGNYHYFTYEQPDGTQREVIPPCGNKAPAEAMESHEKPRNEFSIKFSLFNRTYEAVGFLNVNEPLVKNAVELMYDDQAQCIRIWGDDRRFIAENFLGIIRKIRIELQKCFLKTDPSDIFLRYKIFCFSGSLDKLEGRIGSLNPSLEKQCLVLRRCK